MNDERAAAKDKGNGREHPFEVIDRRPRFEEGTAASSEPRYPTVVEDLKARVEEAERRTREISAAYRALELDREAFRERLNRDLERRVDIARAETLRRVIGVLDDLDRALAAARSAADPRGLADGVALIRDHLFQALAVEGVEAIDTLGHPFDPSRAEAVATEPTEDAGRDNLVIEEVEKGYSLRGTLLRPARVRVARARPGPGVAEMRDPADPAPPAAISPSPSDREPPRGA
jgi:molecular chaperone GrpE